jgi:hypothetical protein
MGAVSTPFICRTLDNQQHCNSSSTYRMPVAMWESRNSTRYCEQHYEKITMNCASRACADISRAASSKGWTRLTQNDQVLTELSPYFCPAPHTVHHHLVISYDHWACLALLPQVLITLQRHTTTRPWTQGCHIPEPYIGHTPVLNPRVSYERLLALKRCLSTQSPTIQN